MRFSIITPSLNQGTWLEENLSSVQRAAEIAGVDVEHIVRDGGSTDSTCGILQKQSHASWVSEQDRGQTDAINKGLSACSGEILAYLCADDFYEPDALALAAEVFRNMPEIDAVYGDAYFLESDSGWKRIKRAGDFSWSRLCRNNFLMQPAVFWRRRVYERMGPLDSSLQYCMDHEYWLRMGEGTKWHYIPHPLATCRLHAGAKTSRALAPAWREAAEMQARYGIKGKPAFDAWWMTVGGQHYYRLKRSLFSAIGKYKASGLPRK